MKPPAVSQGECIRRLECAGFRVDGYTGSHAILRRGTLRVHVPRRDTIGVGLMCKILRQIGMTNEQFEMLKKAK